MVILDNTIRYDKIYRMPFRATIVDSVNGFVVNMHDGGKHIGQAEYSREEVDQQGLWSVRVDVKEKYRNQGVATQLMQIGDEYIRTNHPNDLRLFNDLNGYSYGRYTEGKIIMGIDRLGRLMFRP